jgi:hypothetical protein
VTKLIFSIYEQKDANKSVDLKIILKLNNFNTVKDIIDLCYNLNVKINKINYKENEINLNLFVSDYGNFQNVFIELKRIPNIQIVERKFPLRLALFN